MRYSIVGYMSDDVTKVIKKEKNKFLFYVFQAFGVPTNLFEEDFDISIDNKGKFRKLLHDHKLNIEDNISENCIIFFDGEKVAEFLKPTINYFILDKKLKFEVFFEYINVLGANQEEADII